MMMTCRDCEPLEPRRLLSVVPLGDAVDVSDAKPLRSYDLAIAGTGEFMIARVVGEADPALDEVQVVRYSAAGAQASGPVTIASGSSILRVAVPWMATGTRSWRTTATMANLRRPPPQERRRRRARARRRRP